MPNKKRKCVNCKEYGEVDKGIVKNSFYCSVECMAEHGYKNRFKGAEKLHKEKKRRLKSNDKSLRTREAQRAFNAYIRYRDNADPCISCSRYHQGQWHAGHYKSTGAHSELRFNEDNCHKQCSACNNYLSGNIANYRINLIKKIGQKKVEELEGRHDQKLYTCEELKAIELKYKRKLKQLEE